MKKKKVKLIAVPEESSGRCDGCYLEETGQRWLCPTELRCQTKSVILKVKVEPYEIEIEEEIED